jgi:hypothetical protein
MMGRRVGSSRTRQLATCVTPLHLRLQSPSLRLQSPPEAMTEWASTQRRSLSPRGRAILEFGARASERNALGAS